MIYSGHSSLRYFKTEHFVIIVQTMLAGLLTLFKEVPNVSNTFDMVSW